MNHLHYFYLIFQSIYIQIDVKCLCVLRIEWGWKKREFWQQSQQSENRKRVGGKVFFSRLQFNLKSNWSNKRYRKISTTNTHNHNHKTHYIHQKVHLFSDLNAYIQYLFSKFIFFYNFKDLFSIFFKKYNYVTLFCCSFSFVRWFDSQIIIINMIIKAVITFLACLSFNKLKTLCYCYNKLVT